jgi:hypothetical protein
MTKSIKPRRLNYEQIGMIRGLWEQGALSRTEIAAEIGASPDQVKYQIEKNGWVQGARAEYYEQKALAFIEEQAVEKSKKLTVARETARERAVQLSGIIESRFIKAIKAAEASGATDAALMHDFKALESASRLVQNTFHTKRFALGMDKEESVEDQGNDSITLLEMSADEVEDIKREQELAMQMMDVTPEDGV